MIACFPLYKIPPWAELLRAAHTAIPIGELREGVREEVKGEG